MVTTTSFVKTRERKRGRRKGKKKLQRHITTTTTDLVGRLCLCGCVRACVKNKK